ncbi:MULTISPECIES: hypothetical protein [unclassified Idiomarina]|jgi:hypothetical protein|nr:MULTISPECIES: hypothetical protein [unclassified Idiomarina]MEC7643214.1 hypothetical protein [Pseudomonadota bacterium]NQZ03451.1 hypothetical protein [Idiomarina sp.]|tara:strand:- start:128 stop:271 length:144 start_codon:yes stop_codon:yes gene_type:complete
MSQRRINKTANDARRRAVVRARRKRIIERREKWFRLVKKEGSPKIES